MSKKMKVLILVSLLLNVLLIGIIIGHTSQRLGRGYMMRHHLPKFVETLPDDKKDSMIEAMQKVHLENREIHVKIREARDRALLILTAPVFDEAAYQVQVERVHELRGVMMQKLADAAKEMAEQLNQEERKALAEYLRRPPGFSMGGRPRQHQGAGSHRGP